MEELGVLGLSKKKLAGDIRWQAVFFMGPAGAGKSFVRAKKYMKYMNFKLIDPDEVLKSHPDYDPESPYKLHEWSKEVSNTEFQSIVTGDTGDPVVVDGTGRNSSDLIKKIKVAEESGYRTFLVYVWVPFSVSIYRNRNRDRFVPETVIEKQFRELTQSFKVVKSFVDKYKVIPNYDSNEEARAMQDMNIYPVPQETKPPRPGDKNYGALAASRPVMDIPTELKKIADLLD